MKRTIGVTLLVGAGWVFLLGPQRLSAQACKDDEAMAGDYKQALTDLVETVKKESLPDFEKAFHQKSSLTKLTLYNGIVGGLVSCLDKAAQDTTATKEEVEAYKAKRANFAKLQDKIQHDRDALKAAGAPKDAKALIAKFDLAG